MSEASADSRLLRQTPPSYSNRRFPGASPNLRQTSGKQDSSPKDRPNRFNFQKKIGAGEEIRTLDPNLGKVTNSLLWSIR
jgi:hypothetical protein